MQYKNSKILPIDRNKPLDFVPRGVDPRMYKIHEMAVTAVLSVGLVVIFIIITGSALAIASALGAF